jgi:opacity protein-like surface antigen
MKKYSILASLLLGFVTASVQAGGEVYKQVAPPPPPPLYGTGFYGAIDAGANVYQNIDILNRTFADDDPNSVLFGSSVELNQKHDVGFFGGLKLGYVFGTGLVRPTVEGDFFYNGFNFGANVAGTVKIPAADLEGKFSTSGSSWINTGAFMAKFILRLAPGNQRFQPYVGAGVGGYYVKYPEFVNQVAGVVRNVQERLGFEETNFGTGHVDLAWQVVAGADYYWTPKFSTFIEYHYIDYTTTFASYVVNERLTRPISRNTDVNVGHFSAGDLGQHLVGAGVRFHF